MKSGAGCLPRSSIRLPAVRAPSRLSAAGITILRGRGNTAASAAVVTSLAPRLSLIPAPAGPASGSRFQRRVSRLRWTIVWVWCVLRYCAAAAVPIWGTSLTTARRRLAGATALIRWPLNSSGIRDRSLSGCRSSPSSYVFAVSVPEIKL